MEERWDPCPRRLVEVPEYALLLDTRWEKCLIKDYVPGAEESLGFWVEAYPALVAAGEAEAGVYAWNATCRELVVTEEMLVIPNENCCSASEWLKHGYVGQCALKCLPLRLKIEGCMGEMVVNIHIVDGGVAPKFIGEVGSFEGCPDSSGDGIH